MQRIQRTQEHRSIEAGEKNAHLFEKHLGRSNQAPQTVREIVLELSVQRFGDVAIHCAFAKLAISVRTLSGILCNESMSPVARWPSATNMIAAPPMIEAL